MRRAAQTCVRPARIERGKLHRSDHPEFVLAPGTTSGPGLHGSGSWGGMVGLGNAANLREN
jgi:hypothetical protein